MDTQIITEKKTIMIDYKKLFKKKCKELQIERCKNEYSSAVIKVHETHKNIGEKDEVLLILKLYYLNITKNYTELINIFGDEASEGISIIDSNTKEEIIAMSNIKKANGCFKADVIIKMNKTNKIYCSSIKSKNGAAFAILNHTPRSAKVFDAKKGILNKHLPELDIVTNEYIDKRNKQIIGEDMGLTNLSCLQNRSIYEGFLAILIYFTFEGSGKGDSKLKADSILYYKNNNITFVKCGNRKEKKDYLESILDGCVISLRHKGMPKIISDVCKPWIYEDHGENGEIKPKGSLHIRIR